MKDITSAIPLRVSGQQNTGREISLDKRSLDKIRLGEASIITKLVFGDRYLCTYLSELVQANIAKFCYVSCHNLNKNLQLVHVPERTYSLTKVF